MFSVVEVCALIDGARRPSRAHPPVRPPQWSIKLHSGSSEALQQYRANLTAIGAALERLAHHAEVYWVLQGKAAATPCRPRRAEAVVSDPPLSLQTP